MKYLIIGVLLLTGCDDSKICYPSPIIGVEDECHTEAEWKVISDLNWTGIACMEKETKGAAYGDKKYKKALKTCNLKESATYTTKDLK